MGAFRSSPYIVEEMELLIPFLTAASPLSMKFGATSPTRNGVLPQRDPAAYFFDLKGTS